MSTISRLSALFLFLVSGFALGQSTTQEDLGAITAAQVYSGLGWNVGGSEVEFAAAAAAGATHVRLGNCPWTYVEGQSAAPNNVSSGFALPADCLNALKFAKKYGLSPTVVAAFGSPYHQILSVSLAAPAAAGATSISVEYSSGIGGKSLASVAYPYAYVSSTDNTFLASRHSYPGDLIAGINLTSGTTATITLASALLNDLSQGTPLHINDVLYPAAATGSPTDPSNLAYARYAEFLAGQLNALGLTGNIELWNEPPWRQDCWDNRRDCFDTDPQIPNELQSYGANYGFAAVLQASKPVAGVTYVWAGSNKTLTQGMMSSNMPKYSGVNFIQPQSLITAESLHPYGNNPEDLMWNQPCIVANPKAGLVCNTVPGSGSNMVVGEAQTITARATNPAYGIDHVITETGMPSLSGDGAHMARFVTRQYLGFMADGIKYIDLFRMYEPPSGSDTLFAYIRLSNNNTTYTPLPQYNAIAGLISDLAPMKSLPVAAYSASSLPQVTSYSGTYNLDHLSLVGARDGDKANSIMYVLWQRSQWQLNQAATTCVSSPTVPCWGTIPQPSEASTTVTVPSGMKVLQAVDLASRASVSYSQSGSNVTLGVSDDPIELMFVPSADVISAGIAPKLIFSTVADQKQGSIVLVSANSVSKGAITYSVVSGPAIVIGNLVTAVGPGTVVLQASQAASGSYTAATATTSFNITAITPTITIIAVPTRTYGDPVSIRAGSASTGAFTYAISSGPATISGTAVTLTGAGTVVVQVNQAKSGVYTAATATMSFTVVPKKPILAFASFPPQSYATPLQISASSASNGPITYSILSGPATVSGSTITYTNAGSVVVQASQAATNAYAAATLTGTIHVGTSTPPLAFASIPTTAYNTSFKVSATSPSTGAITYSVVSGPARISGSTVTTLTTAGTVVLKATQAGSGGYGYGSTTTSFSVGSVATPALTFASIANKAPGDVFKVTATSKSIGAITYTVESGPATISGSTVTATGAGTIVVRATQAAVTGFSTATSTITITVTAITPTLTFVSIPSKAQGDVFTVSANSESTGAITYSVVSGPATIAGSTVTATGAGTVVVKASQAATSSYNAATATTTFATLAPPALTFPSIATKSAGDVFNLSAISPSPGAITYWVTSGPAVILSGSTLEVTGAGTVVVTASQAASGTYKYMSAQVSFLATGARPSSLTFQAIPGKHYGDSFTVAATSASPAPVTYSVVSGSASVAGSQVTVVGTTADVTGMVTLQASQAASGSYPASSTTISFLVNALAPIVSFPSIAPQSIGSTFSAKLTSSSQGAITYKVVSGPAHLAGSTVTVTGVGPVVLRADQAAYGNYGPAHVLTTIQGQ